MKPRHIALAIALLVAGCSNRPALVLPLLLPYRMDIQQGNVVTQDMIDKVRPGMSRNQVRFALGTPLIVDLFHEDRWDYVYLFQRGGTVTEQRRIIAIFKDDRLVRIEGDVVPAGSPGTPVGATGNPAATPAKPEPAAPKPAASAAPSAGGVTVASEPASGAGTGGARPAGARP
jgi:outer membrane protein assembly factor BamE